MNPHIIVYLDQNYLSNMAKARIGRIKDNNNAKFWLSLFNDLHKAVLADKIAYPELETQRFETSYSRETEELIRRVIDELSCGLKFHTSKTIKELQIDGAAKKFLGKEANERESWAEAFRTNPNATVESRMVNVLGVKGRINVHIPYPDVLIEHDSQLRNEFADENVIPVNYGKEHINWAELLRREKLSLVESLSGLSLLRSEYRRWLGHKSREYPQIDKLIVEERIVDTNRFYERLSKIGIDTSSSKATADFLGSEELMNIPYIDIFSSINSAIIIHYPHRKRMPSDFYDAPTLAIVLPYCNVVTTDAFMKEILVKRLHFDDKYETKMFSVSKADKIAFSDFIKGLL